MRVYSKRILGALAILAASVMAVGATGTPSAPKILFEAAHLTNLDSGSTLTYSLKQTVSDKTLLGEAIDDKITVAVTKVSKNDRRDVNVSVFTGDRARPVQEMPGRTGNPVVAVFLDRAVKNYSMLSGGPSTYIKNRFKSELAKRATVKPTKISYKGKEIDGFHISVTPFERDPNRFKMRGYDGSTYDIFVSDAVPGYFFEMIAVLESPKEGAPRLEERVTFTGVGSAK